MAEIQISEEVRTALDRIDWEALRDSPAYREGIDAVKALARDGHVVAVVSSEGDPLTSHRFGTVARTLSEEDMRVLHILHNGEVVRHDELEGRLVEKYDRKGILAASVSGSFWIRHMGFTFVFPFMGPPEMGDFASSGTLRIWL